ncbi:MAG TPA: DUF1579 family protein [Thermoanaerobaculia bacterium]|nr:DUF1579 family protein [Thermoanaerobaculia bacterium]
MRRTIPMLLLGCWWAMTASAEPAEPPKPSALEAWKTSAATGASHERLGLLTGSWKVEAQYLAQAGSPPAAGVATIEALLGGRTIEERLSTQLFGQSYEVLYLLGYDNTRKKYWGIWIDNLTSAATVAEGELRPADGALVLEGSYDDPASGTRHTSRSELIVESESAFTLTLFDLGADGSARPSLRLRHTRLPVKEAH